MFRLNQCSFLLFCVTLTATVLCNEMMRPKLIIDNDAGGDDAMAIFLALLHERHYQGPELIGLTTGNGNTAEDKVTINNQRILKVAKRQDVPIYRGSQTALVTTPETTAYYGLDGLGDTGEFLTGLVDPQEQSAVQALIELSKLHEGNLTVITIGTLTNVAMALRLDPHFLSRLEHLYIGAGHIHSKRARALLEISVEVLYLGIMLRQCPFQNHTAAHSICGYNGEDIPNPEFNALMDVEAYHVVMQAATPDKVTVFPFSQTKRSLNLTRSWRLEVLGKIDSDIMHAQNKFEGVSLTHSELWHALDPSVIAVAIQPDLVTEYKYSKNDIITCGEKRGITTHAIVDKAEANVRVVYSVNIEKYKQFLIDVFSADANLS